MDVIKEKQKEKASRDGEDEEEKNVGKTCCRCFSVRTGFILYGLLDWIIVLLIIVSLGKGVAKDKGVKSFAITMTISYIPNCILFVWLLI